MKQLPKTQMNTLEDGWFLWDINLTLKVMQSQEMTQNRAEELSKALRASPIMVGFLLLLKMKTFFLPTG